MSSLDTPYINASLNNNLITNKVAGSIDLINQTNNFIESLIRVDLLNATRNAIETIGPDSTALSSRLTEQNGYLVYSIIVKDKDDNTHLVLIDAGNGRVLVEESLAAFDMLNLNSSRLTNSSNIPS